MNNKYAQFRKTSINLLLTLFTIVLLCTLIEMTCFLFYKKIAPKKGQEVINALVFGQQSQKTGDFENGEEISAIEILPYYLYRNKSFSKIDDLQQVNSEGYRNGKKEFGKKEKNKIRIIAIGGSTTFGWMIKDYKKTWPAQLEKILNKTFNGRVEVVNAGLPGGMSSESLMAFVLKDKYLEPDFVIFHNGGNDAVPLFYDNYYSDYRYHRAISGSDKLRPGEYNIITKSSFVKLVYAIWMQNANLSKIRSEPERKVELKEALTNVEKNYPVGYERNMDTMMQEAVNVGAVPIIFPFYLASSEIYKMIPESMRYAQKLHPAIQEGLKKNKTVLRKLSKKYNAPYYEMPHGTIALKYFFDHCHLTPDGDEIKAEFIASRIEPLVRKRIKK